MTLPEAQTAGAEVRIVPSAEIWFEGWYLALDTVARERRYLAFQAAPPRESAREFFHGLLSRQACQMLAVRAQHVLGWCDILPGSAESRAHVGTLGIGLVPEARGQGIGARLLTAAIARAWEQGLERIELNVRADNLRAIALYQRFGFVTEGIRRRDVRVDGCYFDGLLMALLR